MLTYKKNWSLLSLVLIIIGAAGVINLLLNGEQVMGTTNSVPWGILISGYVFFAVAATGVGLISSLGHVFGIDKFKAIGNRALLTSIVLLLCGFGVLLFELGSPLKMINFLFSPNLSAPIWWMGALYGVYLIMLVIELSYSLKNDHGKVKTVATIAFFVKLAAVSNLGAVFATFYARPFWEGAFYPMHMIVTAILSGAAVLTIVVYLFAKNSDSYTDMVPTLGKTLAAFLAVTLFMEAWQIVVNLYGATADKQSALMALLSGPLSLKFWLLQIVVGLVIPLVFLLKAGYSNKNVFTASVLAVIGLLFMRVNFVIVGQITPLWSNSESPVYNSYTASWTEWSIIIGAIGLTIFLYLLGEQKLNLDAHKEASASVAGRGVTAK